MEPSAGAGWRWKTAKLCSPKDVNPDCGRGLLTSSNREVGPVGRDGGATDAEAGRFAVPQNSHGVAACGGGSVVSAAGCGGGGSVVSAVGCALLLLLLVASCVGAGGGGSSCG